jgi:zinc transport system ATP-binding protein
VLSVYRDGRNIADVLGMTVAAALECFSAEKGAKASRIASKLGVLQCVGLGHLTLGQPLNTLSGGENQRLKLAKILLDQIGSGANSPKMLILDEPANFVDNRFEKELYRTLQELNRRMAVVIVSHDIGTITSVVKEIVCVNRRAHRHRSNILTEEQLRNYDCPIQLVSHGHIPHTVLEHHPGDGCCDGE